MQLLEIQKLQFSNKPLAEQLLLEFLRKNEDPQIESVELRPRAESLNSINGFLSYGASQRYFFKAHVEENEQVSEYYQAQQLEQAGYPVIAARQINHRPGKQIVLYEIVSLPTLFDLLKEEEDLELAKCQKRDEPLKAKLLQAQENLEKRVFDIYKNTLSLVTAKEHAKAPVHQLFSHRLANEGRLGLFYLNKTLKLKGSEISFAELSAKSWRINGVSYQTSLAEIIDKSRRILDPQLAAQTTTVTGHADAHNGNVFAELNIKTPRLWLFDPAFAGRHHPILDLVKPLFHNHFARWMYFPEELSSEIELEYKISSDCIEIEHSFQPSSLRLQMLELKVEHLLKPVFELLQEEAGLQREELLSMLRAALFCCPFLTVNLFAEKNPCGTLAERYDEKIKLLGLSQAVSLASPGTGGEGMLEAILGMPVGEKRGNRTGTGATGARTEASKRPGTAGSLPSAILNVVLIDVDGVLVEARAYKLAVTRSLEILCLKAGILPASAESLTLTESEIAFYESQGIHDVWDILNIAFALILDSAFSELKKRKSVIKASLSAHEKAKQAAGKEPVEDLLLAIKEAALRVKRPDYCSFAKRISRIAESRENKHPPDIALELLAADSTEFEQNLLGAFLHGTRHAAGSFGTRIFQNLILGSSDFKATYGMESLLECQALLRKEDKVLLQEKMRLKLEQLSKEAGMHMAIYTARPSQGPSDLNLSGFSPEAEIAADMAGLSFLPLVGMGMMDWLARKYEERSEDLCKPNTVHCLAALIGALKKNATTAVLDLAYAISRKQPAALEELDLLLQNKTIYIYVLEDTVSGIKPLQELCATLQKRAYSVELCALGIAADPSKAASLSAQGARVFADTNEAVGFMLAEIAETAEPDLET